MSARDLGQWPQGKCSVGIYCLVEGWGRGVSTGCRGRVLHGADFSTGAVEVDQQECKFQLRNTSQLVTVSESLTLSAPVSNIMKWGPPSTTQKAL